MIRTPSSRSTSPLLTVALILVAIASSPYVLRAADGALDLCFGKEGKVRTDFFGTFDMALGVTVQPDGKIVAVGASAGFGIARYNRDGSLDRTFGNGGKVLTTFRGADTAVAVAVQRNGRIVVAGTSATNDPIHPTGFAVARYNRDGSLDLTFGDGGQIITEFPGAFTEARAMALQADGKIVVTGQAIAPQGAGSDIAVARYTADGTLDPTFGGDGTVTIDVEAIDDARAVAVPLDGRIVIAGSARSLTTLEDLAVLRLNRDGSLDSTFGGAGVVRLDAAGGQDFAMSVMIQRNGKIVVAGFTSGEQLPGFFDVLLVRYERNGSLDPTFGTGGVALGDIGKGFDQVTSAALQADGRIVVGGLSSSAGGFTVSRYLTDGSADRTFGVDGVAATSFSTPDEITSDALMAVAIQPDGAIVTAGFTYHFFTSGDSDFALARFDAHASPLPLPR